MRLLRFTIRFTFLAIVCGGVLAALLGRTSSDARAEEPAKVEPGKLQVEFTKGAVVLNGTTLSLPCQRKELVKVLGNPDRESKLANTILTWDELGIHAYQTPKKDEIHSFAITLNEESYAFSPKKLFRGSVKIEGFAVKAESTPEAINRAIKPAVFEESESIGDTWKLKYDMANLYLVKTNSKNKRETSNFSSVQLCSTMSAD